MVSSILILLSQVFITATQEEIFSQRPVLVDLSKNYYVMPLKSRVRKRFDVQMFDVLMFSELL